MLCRCEHHWFDQDLVCVHAYKCFDYSLNEKLGKSARFSDIQVSGILMQPARKGRKFTIFIKVVLKQICSVYVFTFYVVVDLAGTGSAAQLL